MNTKTAYSRFLESVQWKELSSAAKERDGWKCTRCGFNKSLNAHHTFYRSRWEDTQLEDLETLCNPCHKKEHGIKTKPRKKKKHRKGGRTPSKMVVRDMEQLFWLASDAVFKGKTDIRAMQMVLMSPHLENFFGKR